MGDGAAARLPHVVILPQRRPKQRRRGFIRAYAPDLMQCGIDQATFIDFIDGLNKAVSSSPFADTVNLAGKAAGAVPASVASFMPLTGLSIQVAAGVYTEISSRKGQNAYLLRMNDELFRPRGLYCLVMAYDTNSRIDQTPFDQGLDPGPSLPRTFDAQSPSSREKIRSNDGVAGASNFPVPAELIYFDAADNPPAHGDAGSDDSEGSDSRAAGSSFTNSLIKRAAAYNARQDLKSQVKFQRKNPTSLINTVLDPSAELREKDVRKQEKRMAKQERKWEKEDRKAEKRQLKHPEKEPRERKVREGILYLMIINMPSVEEMNAAQAIVGSHTLEVKQNKWGSRVWYQRPQGRLVDTPHVALPFLLSSLLQKSHSHNSKDIFRCMTRSHETTSLEFDSSLSTTSTPESKRPCRPITPIFRPAAPAVEETMKSPDGSADRAPPPPRRSQKRTAVYRKGHRGRCYSCGKYGHKARDCWGPYVHRRSAPSADIVNIHNFHFNGNVNGVSLSSSDSAVPALPAAAAARRRPGSSTAVVNVHNYYFNFKGPVSISLNGGFLAISGAMPSSAAPARACAPTTPARITAPPNVNPGADDKKQEHTNVKMEDADEEIVRWDL